MNTLSRMTGLLLLLVLVGCSGGDDNNSDDQDSGGDIPKPGTTLVGTVAAGAPIVGIVNVKGANGNIQSSNIDIDGNFVLDVADLTAPYILFAEGSVNGRSVSMYSAAVAVGTINITPITDFILRNALGISSESAFNNWTTNQASASQLVTAEADVQVQLAPILAAMSVSANVNLLTTPFTADHTGLDGVLDALQINYTGDSAVVTNLLTGSSYTDNVTLTGDSAGLPATDQTATLDVLSDVTAINAVWTSVTNLYATTTPSSTDINNWFNENVADDFLGFAEDRAGANSNWLVGGGPSVGMVFSALIVKPYDISSNTNYSKAYQVRLFIEEWSFLDTMVFDGAKWLWFGNREWLDEISFDSQAYVHYSSGGTTEIGTGLDIDVEDNTYFAYNQGVRSMVVNGPGLPVDLLFRHGFPDPEFKPAQTSNMRGLLYVLQDDNLIANIPDNAEYLFTLCEETADEILLGSTCTELATFQRTNMKPPVINANLDTSMFATLTAPTSHASANINFGGEITVSWNKPAIAVDEAYVALYWEAAGTYFSSRTETFGETTVLLDTIGMPAPDNFSTLSIRTYDVYSRKYDMEWSIYPGQ